MVWDRHHQVPDTEPASAAEVIDVLTRAMGRDLGVREVGWLSRFHCDERQVSQYRHGRVFLAGDAAHVHSPMGGQGMNTGIQDAVNLAWKLDAVLSGARDDVLDTYQSERHPIGRRVLRQSGLMARGVTLHPRIGRVIRNLLAQLRGNPAAIRTRARRQPSRRHQGNGDPARGRTLDASAAVRGFRPHPRTVRRRATLRGSSKPSAPTPGPPFSSDPMATSPERLFGQWRDEQCAEPVDRTHPSTAMCIAAR
jgi:flavin-dependent dehydrogenase